MTPHRIHVIDSHTGGEPTRVVVGGGPPLGAASMRERLEIFRTQYDHYRSAIVNEPRGSDAIVGALLCEPSDTTCAAGVIFFNNVGYLGMCGHGTIALAVTLAYMGKMNPGTHRIETPVGVVEATLEDTGAVTINNVPSYRLAKDVSLRVEGFGEVTGEVAWGGNWFFMTDQCPTEISPRNLDHLVEYAWQLRLALRDSGIAGTGGQEIDHIELYGPPTLPGADSKNFVLCPGKSYDRSPCGTGTSAKVACLYADGRLREGEVWRQESLIGSVFEGWVSIHDGKVYPHIRGTAYVNSEAQLVLDERDPFRWGMPDAAIASLRS